MALSGASRADDWSNGDGLFMQVARQGLIFDTLTEVAADGTLHAELAASWQASEGGRVWVFEIRKNVPFHDGKMLSAQDVVVSLGDFFASKVGAIGTHAVQFQLDRPMMDLPFLLAQPEFIIRPAHAPNAGIGTGLYKVALFEAGKRLLTRRVEQHYKDGNAGWFDEVELTSIPAEPVRAQALGEYLVDAVDLKDASALKGLNDINILPTFARPSYAVLSEVAQPSRLGTQYPLDNLRAAERWWFARS